MIDVMKIGREEVFTLMQASERTGLSPNTFRAQIKNGVLPATLMGKTFWVRAKDLDAYMRNHAGNVGRPRKNPDAPIRDRRKPRPPTGGTDAH